jgi:hypothetical protein
MKEYTLTHDYFNNLNYEGPAYWLGVLSSDGFVSQKNSIGMEISIKDIEWLELFKETIKSNHKISDRIRGKAHTCSLAFRSPMMSTRLRELGLVHNKTYNLEPCNLVPKEQKVHYYRGLFDGDGSIFYRHSTRSNHWCVNFRNTKPLVRGFAKFVGSDRDVRKSPRRNGENYIIEFSGNPIVQRILHLLYGNCNFYLPRKYNLYKTIISIPPRPERLSQRVSSDEIVNLYNEEGTWDLVARRLGVSCSYLNATRKELGLFSRQPRRPRSQYR